MSNFQVSTVERNLDLGAGTSIRQTVKLDNAFPISRIYVRERATHATSINITVDRVEVLLDGSPVIAGLSGADIRDITKFQTGRTFADAAAGADITEEYVLNFGRFGRDEEWFLPAPLFSSAKLQWEATLSATPVLSELSVVVEQILGIDPTLAVMRKLSQFETLTPTADKQHDFDIPTGELVGAVYVRYNDVDNIDGGDLRLGVNNFTRSLFEARRESIEAFNKQSIPFHDNLPPAQALVLDMTLLGQTGKALDTAGLSSFELRTKAASSGVAGDIRAIVEELIPVT